MNEPDFEIYKTFELSVKILMVDDYPMILSGYEYSLQDYAENRYFDIYKAYNSNEAIVFLNDHDSEPFDVIFLDIKLPISEEKSLINGEDLGLKIREKYKSKIIVISSITNEIRVSGILKNLQPEAFISKVETTPEVLLTAIDTVMQGASYYCKNTQALLAISSTQDNFLDSLDLKILYFISLGEKVKNLPQFVPLSLPSIERRKKKIKDY